ncbi:MAG TPA: hypothetical protein VGZ25_01605, partial [Gemmataceae bacterium]|nr:hypothetical protein [Gemmataceae bacterium]
GVLNEIGLMHTRDLGLHEQALTYLEKAEALKEDLLSRDPSNLKLTRSLARSYVTLSAAQIKSGTRHEQAGACLEKLRIILEKLAADHAGEVDLDEDFGSLYSNQGGLAHATKRFDDALKAYRKMREMYEKVVQKDPRSSLGSFRLATSYLGEGLVCLDQHKPDAALEALDNCRKGMEPLVRDNPGSALYAQDLSRCYYCLANAEKAAGRAAKGLPWSEKASEVMEQLTTHDPLEAGFAKQMFDNYGQTGVLLMMTGQRTKVIPAWEKARMGLERKARENPDNLEFVFGLAQVDNNIGSFYLDVGQNDKASVAYQKVLDTLANLKDKDPKNAEKREFLEGSVNFNLGLLAFNNDHPAEAIAYYEKAKAIHERECTLHPEDLNRFATLASDLMSIGDCHRIAGNLDKAKEFLDKAVGILEPLVHDHPDEVEPLINLGNTYATYGSLHKKQNQFPEAMARFDQSIALFEGVLKTKGRQIWAENSLAANHFNKGEIYTLQGNHEEALKEWDKTIPYDKPQDKDETRMKRAGTLALLGRHSEAMKDAGELAAKKTAKKETYYDAACIFALASGATAKDNALTPEQREKSSGEQAQKAMEFLTKAKAQGYFKSKDKRSQLVEDKDLEAIRSRPEFKALQAEVERSKESEEGTP